ncbi:MAG: type III pantothenate kinase [Flavobacteriaceae bacterium]|jgi:type III pantothenate kinase|nr:type III pantothenate kinase [Flavobacteriaceae bacterium]
MIFTIDAGNTRTKLSIFESNTIIEQHVFENNDLEKKIKTFFSNYHEKPHVVMSSVVNFEQDLSQWLQENTTLTVISHTTPLPFVNKYSTPNSLGIDRIVLAAGATLMFPNQNKLIIDAGTCITYDFVTNQEEYLGGGISPGLTLRYKSLNDHTAKLPLLQLNDFSELIGNSTEQSIHSGVINGTVQEIEGIINEYKLLYPNLTIILTGGDTVFLAKRLKNIIFANSTFLPESLNLLYQYTIENGQKNFS